MKKKESFENISKLKMKEQSEYFYNKLRSILKRKNTNSIEELASSRNSSGRSRKSSENSRKENKFDEIIDNMCIFILNSTNPSSWTMSCTFRFIRSI